MLAEKDKCKAANIMKSPQIPTFEMLKIFKILLQLLDSKSENIPFSVDAVA